MMRTGFCCYQLSSPAFYKLDKVRAQVNQNKMADEEAAIAAIPSTQVLDDVESTCWYDVALSRGSSINEVWICIDFVFLNFS